MADTDKVTPVNTKGGTIVNGDVHTDTFIGRDQINNYFAIDNAQLEASLEESLSRFFTNHNVDETSQYLPAVKLILSAILSCRLTKESIQIRLDANQRTQVLTWQKELRHRSHETRELADQLKSIPVPYHARGSRSYLTKAAKLFEAASHDFPNAIRQKDLKFAAIGTRKLSRADDQLQIAAGIISRAVDPTITEADGARLLELFLPRIAGNLHPETRHRTYLKLELYTLHQSAVPHLLYFELFPFLYGAN